MNVPRKQIATALLSLLQGANANISLGSAKFQQGAITRKPLVFASTPPASQPAMYVVHAEEEGSQNFAFGATKWAMWFVLVIYFKPDASSAGIPDDIADAILDGIEETLSAGPQAERQTLGGIVTNCYIQGRVTIGTTAADTQQMFMLVPVKVDTGI